MKLYTARWPDGSAWLVGANSMEEVAEILDEVADPGACEVSLYKGPLAIEFKPSPDGEIEFQSGGVDTGSDMYIALTKKAYPNLHKLLTSEDELESSDWARAVEAETRRQLRPSSRWAAAVQSWWEDRCGGLGADRTAALRAIQGVTIPGEPRPETPEQERLFQEAQRRIFQEVAARISGTHFPETGSEPWEDDKPPGRE